jgi:hypothetical protein
MEMGERAAYWISAGGIVAGAGDSTSRGPVESRKPVSH